MPHEVKLWQIDVADELVECTAEHLDSEGRLEKWIEKNPTVLASDLLIIGRQVETAFGGWIDLLALDAEADLVVIELKRNKTPREVVAQALDYASWVKELSPDDVCDIAARTLEDDQSLEDAFRETFGEDLPETINRVPSDPHCRVTDRRQLRADHALPVRSLWCGHQRGHLSVLQRRPWRRIAWSGLPDGPPTSSKSRRGGNEGVAPGPRSSSSRNRPMNVVSATATESSSRD